MSIHYTDRSRVLRYQGCPRAAWFEYYVPTEGVVPGVVPNRLNSDLIIGSGFHVGVEALLTGASEDEAVGRALQGHGSWPGFWPLVKDKGLVLGDLEDSCYVYNEQASLIEALIRGYNRFCLPQLLERFDVVEVERDGSATFTLGDFEVVWGYRADALLMEKETLDLYVLSLKTAKDFNKKKAEGGNRDMQGLSEVAAIDQRLQRWEALLNTEFKEDLEMYLTNKKSGLQHSEEVPDWFILRHLTGAPPQCFGVKMEYALKGLKLEDPKGSGVWKYSNPLIRPWKYAEDLGGRGKRLGLGGEKYAVSYEFRDDMGGGHRLGKGWTRINIWEDMGVKSWIDYVSEETIQGFYPGYAIEQQFALPPEFYRNDEDIERWKKRILFGERRKAEGLVQINKSLENKDFGAFEDLLDEYFEPHSERCDYPTKCVYQDICYGANKGYLFNPMTAGIYETRTPNHVAEDTK